MTMSGAARRAPWEERPTAVGQAGKGVVLFVVIAAVLVPLWVVVLTSPSTTGAIGRAGGLVIWPDGLTLDAYRQMLTNSQVTRALPVRLAVTLVGTALSMVVSVLCAYGLSRSRSLGAYQWPPAY
jgi:multiple sugar transport system permease protein/putative aldouronate transport system permease protein